jgi:hypothetical protein
MSVRENPVEAQKPAPKKPYAAPQLKELGNVRDLTLAGAGSVGDGLLKMAM